LNLTKGAKHYTRSTKMEEDFKKGFTKLQSYIYENAENGSVTMNDIVGMCKHFLNEDIAIEILKDRYEITKKTEK